MKERKGAERDPRQRKQMNAIEKEDEADVGGVNREKKIMTMFG